MMNYPLNINITEKIYKKVDEMEEITFINEKFNKKEIFDIFIQYLEEEIIAFKGEPLKGVQIVGLFETRALYFDNVIICDVNEGILPGLRKQEILIPREIMLSMGLKRTLYEEEIQRYQLMRLIDSAKQTHIIYQEGREKERSRFIEELIWEKEKKNKKIENESILIKQVGFNLKIHNKIKEIKKTEKIIDFLKQIIYSPSSINTYLNSPISFFEQKVLGVREEENLLEETQANEIGNFLHKILEKKFKVFKDREVIIDTKFKKDFMECLEKEFEEKFYKRNYYSVLSWRVIKNRMEFFLEKEEERVERVEKICDIEVKYGTTILILGNQIKMEYIMDRVDLMKSGEYLIIDYKTGMKENKEKINYKRISDDIELSREIIKEKIKSFQLPIYTEQYYKHSDNKRVQSAIYNLKDMKMTYFPEKPLCIDNEEKEMKFFYKAFNFIMEEILNPEISFKD